MNARQVYEQSVMPLSRREKLTLARLILHEFESQEAPAEAGFDYLKRLLPQIERLTLTDEDLAGVSLNAPSPDASSR